MTEKNIRDAYVRIRTIDQTIPDEVLDFMKDAAINALNTQPLVAELNDMATDEVLDHYIKKFKQASDYLGNAFDQAEGEVTKDQEQRIKAILWFWSAKLAPAKPVLE